MDESAVVPDNYVDADEWQRIRTELAWESFKGLGLTELGKTPFLAVEDAEEHATHVRIDVTLPEIPPQDDWWDGRQYYYDPDVRPRDLRHAMLEQLRKVQSRLVASIERQPAIDKPPPGLEAERDTHCRHGVPYTQFCEDCGT